jgi:hypothetical protein
MPEFIETIKVIFPIIVIGILAIFIAILIIYLRVWDKSIVRLYMEGKYQESIEKIRWSKRIAFGRKKQWLDYYEALIFIAESNYDASRNILLTLKSKKLEKPKLFWLCFIEIELRNIEKANLYFDLFIKYENTDENEIAILRKMIESIIKDDVSINAQVLSKVKNPIIMKYINKKIRIMN